jgi:RHS repeat-associated protein
MKTMKNTIFAAAAFAIASTAAAADWTTGPYLYDGSGNIVSAGTDQFVYDKANRIKSGTAKGPSHQQDYSYDPFGNRLGSYTATNLPCANGITCDGIPLVVDPLTNHVTSGGAKYDDAGSLAHYAETVRATDFSVIETNRAHDYSYDSVGMISLQLDGSNKRQYVYTADDQRIAVYTNQEWRWSLRDLDQKVVRDFTSKDGSSFAITEDRVHSDRGVIGSASPSGRRHMHVDHLGSARVITGDLGQFLGEHAYFPFGTELQLTTEDPAQRLKFTGHERDTIAREPMSLDYMHARYYSALEGRFTSIDPKERRATQPRAVSWNRYAYSLDNPLLLVDSDGKDPRISAWFSRFGDAWEHVRNAGAALANVPIVNGQLRVVGMPDVKLQAGPVNFEGRADVRLKTDSHGETKVVAAAQLTACNLGPQVQASLPLVRDGQPLPDGAGLSAIKLEGAATFRTPSQGAKINDSDQVSVQASVGNVTAQVGADLGKFAEAAHEFQAAASELVRREESTSHWMENFFKPDQP